MEKTNSLVIALTLGLLLVAGCATTKPHITREQYLANSKINIAVMPFEGDHWGVTEHIIGEVQDLGFTVVERYRIKQIVTEQSFGLSGLTESNYYNKIGKLLGVDYIIYGSAYSKYVPYHPPSSSGTSPPPRGDGAAFMSGFAKGLAEGIARGSSGTFIYASFYRVDVKTGEIKVLATDRFIKKL